jgi:CRISPR system Cascade subunit CasE
MYRSTLLVDTGSNPDRPRPGRLWLRNIYHVHQRLCMAFPMREMKEVTDPYFLHPFNPRDFPEIYESDGSRKKPIFLFRIDRGVRECIDGGVRKRDTQTMILVQSELVPDWDYAFQNAPLLHCYSQPLEFTPAYATDDHLRFRILINLTIKDKSKAEPDKKGRVDNHGRLKTQSKRVGLYWDKDQNPTDIILPWFREKANHNGFTIEQSEITRIGWIKGKKPKIESEPDNKRPMWYDILHKVALIEGNLIVTDVEKFCGAIENGIGSAKAFGCGLLSVAPLM